MRPKQWAKNSFLFAGLIFDGQLVNLPASARVIGGFTIFNLIASIVYIINDLSDADADRAHPQKKHRPIASGQLPVPVASGFAVLLAIIALPAAYLLSRTFALICVIYLVLNLSYSKWFKHIPILDVFVLASFYVIRVIAGISLIVVERFSPWLYIVTTLLALFIGFGKRRAELSVHSGNVNTQRRVLEGYTIPLLDQFITIVSGTTIVAYSLYTFSAPNLPENHTMMLTIPFVLYGIFRYLYLIHFDQGDSPEDIVMSDIPIMLSIAGYALAVLIIFYLS